MSTDHASALQATPSTAGHRHTGIALVVIAAAQLMVVLDATITNIALPSIQTDLHMSSTNLAWVVNSYALAFGGLLLLGGKVGDLLGRRRMFIVGVSLFFLASLVGGLAPNQQVLITARVVQGAAAAIAAPAALSLIATNFAEGKERHRAMGVYAAMAGLGSTIGLLLGGVLTNYLDWRWVFFINLPIGLIVLLGTRVLSESERHHGRLDVPGAITGTAGLVALVYAITRAGQSGWSDALVLGGFVAAAVLLAVFLVLQARVAHPVLPLRLLKDRSRSGSYATMLFLGAGMFATFYFLTLYMQDILHYTPVKTGVAYLPFSVGMVVGATTASQLLQRVAPRVLAGPGLIVAAVGMFLFHRLTPSSSYWADLAPAMFVTAIGLGLSFVPMAVGAVADVDRQDAGIASALLNTAQQVGGALGLAVLTTIATTTANNRLPQASATFYRALASHNFPLVARAGDALTHGYTTSFLVSAGLFLAGAVITVLAINARPQAHDAEAPPVHAG